MRVLALCALLAAQTKGQWTHDAGLRRQTSRRVAIAPARVIVNLDLPPRERWAFLKDEPLSKTFKADFTNYVSAFVPKAVFPLLTNIVGHLRMVFDDDYAQEMAGIATALDLPIGDVVLINLIYQLEQLGSKCDAMNTTGPCPGPRSSQPGPGLCTGLVAQGPSEQDPVWQGRNMDWNLNAKLLQYVREAEYQKGGVTLFTGVHIAGMVGVLHGLRKGAFSVQINARDDGGSIFANAIEQLLLGARTPSHVLRRTLETSADFHAAEVQLSSARLANPVYYVLAGAVRGQGAVITRSRSGAVDTWYLNAESEKDSSGINDQPGWFRFQTNYDHWQPVPSFDDRRTPGVAHVREVCSAAVNAETVMKVMTMWPTRNHHTDITSIMCPATGYMATTLWLPAADDLVVV